MSKEGTKYDTGKIQYGLIKPEVLKQLATVLTFGAEKYGKDDWTMVKNFDERYHNALMRHIEAWRLGEIYDKETGLPHLTHALACTHFLLYNQLKNDK